MDEITIIQVGKDELDQIVQDAVRAAMTDQTKPAATKPLIKGIHALAKFLAVSPTRAQKLKNEGVLPYFQNNRLVLFDPDKVREAMSSYNQKRKGR